MSQSILRWLEAVALIGAAAGCGYYVLCLWAARKFMRDRRRQAAVPAADAPPISILKPLRGTDPDIYAKAKAAGRINDLPVNHSPLFAPVIHPTLQTGIEAMVAGALAWLAK